jgi:hypothetical protein
MKIKFMDPISPASDPDDDDDDDNDDGGFTPIAIPPILELTQPTGGGTQTTGGVPPLGGGGTGGILGIGIVAEIFNPIPLGDDDDDDDIEYTGYYSGEKYLGGLSPPYDGGDGDDGSEVDIETDTYVDSEGNTVTYISGITWRSENPTVGMVDSDKIEIMRDRQNDLEFREIVYESLGLPSSLGLNIMITTPDGEVLLCWGESYANRDIVDSYTRNCIAFPNIEAEITVRIFR